MGLNKSEGMTSQAIVLMDVALSKPAGCEMTMPDKRAAIAFRSCCYAARHADRNNSKRIYEPGTPEYGTSRWDCLTIDFRTQPDGTVRVLVRTGMAVLESMEIRDIATGERITLGDKDA